MTIETGHALNIPKDFNKHNFIRNAAENHKAISMASQQEVLDNNSRRGRQAKQSKGGDNDQSNVDAMNNYMKRTIALIEKNENEMYINFALDLPNLNF